MKKIYSFVLMATMLLIGTTAWANTYTIGGDGADYANLKAFKTAMPSLNLSSEDVITLGANQNLAVNGVYDFRGARINTGTYRFNITAASTYTIKNAVISGTSNIFLGNKNNASGDVTLILENVKATTTGAQVFDVRVFNYNVTFDENCVMSSASQTFNVYDANVSMNVTNNADMDWSIATRVVNAQAHTFTNNAGNFTYNESKNKALTGNITINGSNGATAVVNQYDDSRYAVASSLTLNNITVAGGTIVTPIQGSNITVTGGTFITAPDAGATGTIDGECQFPDGPQFGGLTVASGYKIFKSGAVRAIPSPGQVVEVRHADNTTQTYEFLEDAFAEAQNGDVITLLDDVNTYTYIWVGTKNVADDAKSLKLDLAGHTLTSVEDVQYTIVLTHGALYIKNSVPGQGGIVHQHNASSKASDIIHIIGSPERMKKGGEYINPRNAAVEDLFVYLLIDEGVTLSATNAEANGVTVLENREYGNIFRAINYYTNVYSAVDPQYGVANGVRVDIKGTINVTKYAGKINGTIRHPNEMIHDHAGMTDAQEADTANSTFFHIFPTAVMHTSDALEATAVYSSGYGRWLIQGLCQGATGVYVKSGVVDLTDAVIESTYTGTASITTGGSSGVSAGGNAVVIESNNNYTGQQAIVIGGDTKISTEAQGGAAVVDIVDDTHDSKVESIVINGGTFSGGENGAAIVISSETAGEQTTTVNGVTVTGEISVGGSTDPEDVADIMGSNTHSTVINNEDGSKTVVISGGSAPATDPDETYTSWEFIAGVANDSLSQQKAAPSLEWTMLEDDTIKTGTIYLKELLINSGTGIAKGERQQLVINDGASLQVERLIMNKYARIIVEAGGKLIVSGTQGINAPDSANILLKMSESDQAMFLFHPAVSSNRHPLASVQLVSKGYKNGNKYIWQRFGIPAYLPDFTRGAVVYDHVSAASAFYGYDYEIDNWKAMTDADTFVPFQCYEVTSGATAPGTLYTFQCAIMGNTNHELGISGNWNYYANSYSAPINIYEMLNSFVTANAGLDATAYVYRSEDNWWDAINLMDYLFNEQAQEEIAPMQAFIFKQGNGSNESVINYEDHIYNPIMNPANNAPKRSRAAISKAMIEITAADGTKDEIRLVENDMFSADYDNGYDAAKYMNAESFNLFATINGEEISKLATDNLEGTMLNMTTKAQTSFVMTFKNVDNMDYAIRDMLTGTETAIVEGASYMFSVPENANIEGRFQIVGKANMPTSIDNIEETAAVKGIYTITGQFVGNDYHSLPAGVYVVDGKKIIK